MALHPWIEGWVCRSMLLAGGSTLPRQRCSLAVLPAERLGLLPLLEPEMPLDLERKTKSKVSMTSTLKFTNAYLHLISSISTFVRKIKTLAAFVILQTVSYFEFFSSSI